MFANRAYVTKLRYNNKETIYRDYDDDNTFFKDMNLDKDIIQCLERNGCRRVNKTQFDIITSITSNNGHNTCTPSLTGSGYSLAYLIGICNSINRECKQLQAIIILPHCYIAYNMHMIAKQYFGEYINMAFMSKNIDTHGVTPQIIFTILP